MGALPEHAPAHSSKRHEVPADRVTEPHAITRDRRVPEEDGRAARLRVAHVRHRARDVEETEERTERLPLERDAVVREKTEIEAERVLQAPKRCIRHWTHEIELAPDAA
jgi:hypothetical protein